MENEKDPKLIPMVDILIELMEEIITDKVTLKNQMAMIGIALTLSDFSSKIEKMFSKEKSEEIDNRAQEIWEKWYSKNQKFTKDDIKTSETFTEHLIN